GAGARGGGGDQIWLRAAGGRDLACRAREGDRRLLPARLLRDLRLLFEDDLQRAAALRSSAGEQRPDRDRIGGSCRRITLTCDGEPVALGGGPVAEQPRRAAPSALAAPQTPLYAPWLLRAPRPGAP